MPVEVAVNERWCICDPAELVPEGEKPRASS